MNRFAYLTTGLAIKGLSGLSKANINIHGQENIPKNPVIFVINHFTRMETLLIPYHIYNLTDIPVWSLADSSLFKGMLGTYLDLVGAVSTKNPDKDLLIVKTLLTGETNWIIFPEGQMVKNKKISEKGRFVILTSEGKKIPPHTGAASLALRAEYYRNRLIALEKTSVKEAEQLMAFFKIDSIESIADKATCIVPVNLTYYPIRARDNIVSTLASKFVKDIPERVIEEIMTEGTMLLSGVDIDIRFGNPIYLKKYINNPEIAKDIYAVNSIVLNATPPSKKTMKKISHQIMLKYMTDIYNLTTINHDHLFASFLKLTPFKKISESNLLRRVFLAVSYINDIKKDKLHVHRSLMESQTHLLIDDCFNKYKNFLTLALEKQMIKKHGNILLKNAAKFENPLSLDKIQVDNPVEIIANEVEPVKKLHTLILNLIWQPEFLLKKNIAMYLMKKAVSDYEKEYMDHYIPGETKPKNVGMPYLIKGDDKKTGIVLVHGYMSAPAEVKQLAEYLGNRGIWVYAPRLKGHGTSPYDLENRSYKEWIQSVEDGYAIISNMCNKVFLGGFSTGAGLALDLTSRIKNPAGVIAICPPIQLQDFSSKFVPAVEVWNRIMEKIKLDSAKKGFVESIPENPHINYFKNPVSGVRELGKLMDKLEEKLQLIKTPSLVIQSDNDPVVNSNGSKRLFELLGSQDKEYILLNFNRHVIVLGEGSERVHKAVWNFIKRL